MCGSPIPQQVSYDYLQHQSGNVRPGRSQQHRLSIRNQTGLDETGFEHLFVIGRQVREISPGGIADQNVEGSLRGIEDDVGAMNRRIGDFHVISLLCHASELLEISRSPLDETEPGKQGCRQRNATLLRFVEKGEGKGAFPRRRIADRCPIDPPVENVPLIEEPAGPLNGSEDLSYFRFS